MWQCVAKPDSEPAGGSSGLPSARARDTTGDVCPSNIAKPDTSHMLPFRPSATSGMYSCKRVQQQPSFAIFLLIGVGMNAVPGGHFPLPSEVTYLMSRLPPPHCFNVRIPCAPTHTATCLTILLVVSEVLLYILMYNCCPVCTCYIGSVCQPE